MGKKQYKVGDVTIGMIDDQLFFDQRYEDDPERAIMAILAVARHLGWARGPFFKKGSTSAEQTRIIHYEDERSSEDESYSIDYNQYWRENVPVGESIWQKEPKPFILPATLSKSGQTVYVGNKSVMYVSRTGNTERLTLTKSQICGAWNDWYYNVNKIFIPGYAWQMLSLLTVEEQHD